MINTIYRTYVLYYTRVYCKKGAGPSPKPENFNIINLCSKKNTQHLQPALLPYGHYVSALSKLPEKHLKLLRGSWSESFYRDFFCRLDEEIFAVLYASEPSRPNVPVNVLTALEVLKAGFGWSDEELYENFCFNFQVRYALGYDRLGDGDFAIRTLYYFRERLSKHYLENGINLLEQVFEQVTDAQSPRFTSANRDAADGFNSNRQ